MYQDSDIKIAGDKPSVDVTRNKQKSLEQISVNSTAISAAKAAGKSIAVSYIDAVRSYEDEDSQDFELLLQRRLLLSFTATVGFEQYIKDDTLSGIAQKSFLDTLKKLSPEIYGTSSDTGAFSFYYLAYRHGNDTERRMGQTFAMLCSHDGDPIFQELGEAIYCWFLSVVRGAVNQYFPPEKF